MDASNVASTSIKSVSQRMLVIMGHIAKTHMKEGLRE